MNSAVYSNTMYIDVLTKTYSGTNAPCKKRIVDNFIPVRCRRVNYAYQYRHILTLYGLELKRRLVLGFSGFELIMSGAIANSAFS